ncbi:putative ribonuclease H-like domain-containing protein [Tanacetum coccineum]
MDLITLQDVFCSSSPLKINFYGLVIMEYLVNISKRRAFWSLNKDILKITILITNTPYPSKKIRHDFVDVNESVSESVVEKPIVETNEPETARKENGAPIIEDKPALRFIRPFRHPVTILNTIDHLENFDGKDDEGFFVGYSTNSKAFRVFNSRTRIVEENLHVKFSEETPNIVGNGPNWLFDIDALTKSMNYDPVVAGNQSNGIAGTKACENAGKARVKTIQTIRGGEKKDVEHLENEDSEVPNTKEPRVNQEQDESVNSTNNINIVSLTVNNASIEDNVFDENIVYGCMDDQNMPNLEEIIYSDDDEDVDVEADMTRLDTYILVSPTLTTRIYKDRPLKQIIGDIYSTPQTRRMTKSMTDHVEPKKGYTQEEGIEYDEVFALVARIEAIRLLLAYASFKDFVVYRMDVKSAFLYGKIKKEVYVCQPPGFEDLELPNRVYKVEKALYGLHQAPRAWYEILSTYLLDNGFKRGQIDKTLFIKRVKGDILLVQVSSMGELTFFLGLQVTQKDDGIFISQDKYVDEILKKFGFSTVKTARTPMETSKSLMKDENAEDVDVHLYRSMIGSLMYLTSSRPDIMFVVCACTRFQVTPKVSYLYAVKRIFRYLNGQPKLGLWYPKDLPFDLEAYTDSDYAGASLDRKSTTRGCQFLERRLISWQCKKQTVVANSTTEAAYVAASSFKNPVFHSKTKHNEIRHHFIRDSYEKILIQLIKIHTDHNVADLLTKAFDINDWNRLEMLRIKLGLKLITQKVNAKVNAAKLLTTAGLPLELQLLRVFLVYKRNTSLIGSKFVDSHNMVAYMEKSTENADFDEIVDFLNANPIRYALTTHKCRKTKRPTEISQSSRPTTLVADETVYEDRGDNMERAATTTASLDAECQDTILGDRPAQTRFERLSKQSNDPPLLGVNTPGKNVKTAQDLEITSLKKRVKKLEKKKKARTLQLKRRLFKVRIESSADKSLGDQEDASKHRRNIAESDQDEEISFVQKDAETQGRYDQDIDVIVVSAPITNVGVSVSVAELSTPPTTTTVIEDEDLIIAQTLMKMRSEKSKEKAKERGSKEKSSEPTTRPTRGVTMQEPSESGTRKAVPPSQHDLKDKGKAKIIKPEKPLKKKDQIKFDEEVAKRLAEELEAEIEAYYELAQRLQAEEQGELTIEERSRLFVELMDKRKKHFKKIRAEKIRRKPPTKAQKRNQMSTYQRNMAGYKHTQLKNKSFEEIQMLFDKEIKRVNSFVHIDSKVVEGSGKKTKCSRKETASKKRAGEELDEESVKRQKLEDDAEKAKLQLCLEIVPRDDEAVNIIRADRSKKYYKIFSAMLDDFDRQDVLDLYRLVKEIFKTSSPEGYDRLLWGDLITLFEPSEEDEIWKAQQDYTLIS